MKIKQQLRFFLAGIIAIPIFCISFLPFYHYLNRPDKILISGTQKVKKILELPLSERDIDLIKDNIKRLPPDVEFILILNQEIVLTSNFQEFKGIEKTNYETIFNLIKHTCPQYFYQLVTIPLVDNNSTILLVSRIIKNKHNEKNPNNEANRDKKIIAVILFLAAIETYIISTIIKISRTISNSIIHLEKNAKQIASGELDTKLEIKAPKHENEITSLTNNLEKMRLTLKDNEERRVKFIMGVSHDLRTPIAIIKGYTEALCDGLYENSEQSKKALEIISLKTEQLELMINNLISFVKLNHTEWIQCLKKQNIVPVIKDCAKNCITYGEIFKRIVIANIDLPEYIEVQFDYQLFRRAIENLFTNAVRYTNEANTIKIAANINDNTLEIKVSDTGIGIEKEDIEKIYDMFYRGTSSRRESGMGIGLSIVKTVMDIHGWNITVISELNRGTEFTIHIPIKSQ